LCKGLGDFGGGGTVCGGGGGGLGGFLEGVAAAAVPALCSGLEEFDLAEHSEDEGIALAAAIVADFVATVIGVVVFVFFRGFGGEEGFGGDEAELVVEDGFFDDGFCDYVVDGLGVAVVVAAGCGACGGGDAGGDVGLDGGHGLLLWQGAEGDLEAV
jgi:hypothetical protein